MAFAVLVDVVPPAETNQQPSRHILDRPEVHGQQRDHGYERCDETCKEQVGEHIEQNRCRPKQQVEDHCHRIPLYKSTITSYWLFVMTCNG